MFSCFWKLPTSPTFLYLDNDTLNLNHIMAFKPTKYQLINVGSGRIFEDAGWTLTDPEGGSPSLLRAVYEKSRFAPREDYKGLFRYADWLPIGRTLRNSHPPVTYKSKGLASLLELENLYITQDGVRAASVVLAGLEGDEGRVHGDRRAHV